MPKQIFPWRKFGKHDDNERIENIIRKIYRKHLVAQDISSLAKNFQNGDIVWAAMGIATNACLRTGSLCDNLEQERSNLFAALENTESPYRAFVFDRAKKVLSHDRMHEVAAGMANRMQRLDNGMDDDPDFTFQEKLRVTVAAELSIGAMFSPSFAILAIALRDKINPAWSQALYDEAVSILKTNAHFDEDALEIVGGLARRTPEEMACSSAGLLIVELNQRENPDDRARMLSIIDRFDSAVTDILGPEFNQE